VLCAQHWCAVVLGCCLLLRCCGLLVEGSDGPGLCLTVGCGGPVDVG
jgi:hypothetical protein